MAFKPDGGIGAIPTPKNADFIYAKIINDAYRSTYLLTPDINGGYKIYLIHSSQNDFGHHYSCMPEIPSNEYNDVFDEFNAYGK